MENETNTNKEIKEPKIGIALGGGGAKGAAHVGVLRVFEKYGIKISAIAGASAGSVIGAGYALGLSIDEIVKRTDQFNKGKFLRFSNFHLFRESLIKSKDVEKVIKKIVEEKKFKDTKIPFQAIAVDLESGLEVVIQDGYLWEALMASSAIPGVFSPYFLNDRYLVDGGLLNSIPVNVLRTNKELDIILGVDVGSLTSKQYIAGMIWERYYRKPQAFKLYPGKLTMMKLNLALMLHIVLRSMDIVMDEAQRNRFDVAKPDLIIKPDVSGMSLLEFDHYEEGIKAGMEAAELIMPKLQEIIAKKKLELNK